MSKTPVPVPWCSGLLAVGLAVGAIPTHPAVAETLCVKRSGPVVARAKCRSKEQPFDPAALGLVGPEGPPGPAGADGPPGTPGGHPYRVVAATGQPFGTMIAFDTARAQVLVTLPGVEHPVQFVVSGGEFDPELTPIVYYQQPDCAGTPFVTGSFGLVPSVVVVGSVGYFATAGASVLPLASREFPTSDSCSSGTTATDRGTCCSNMTFQGLGAPARAIPIADLGVAAPFTVQP